MKNLFIGLLAFGSISAFAVECNFPSNAGDLSGGTLSISDANSYIFKNAKGEVLEDGSIQKVLNLGQEDFKKNKELHSYMTRSGLRTHENFIYADIFLTDSNSIGSSGLIVFYGGRGSIIAKSYILGPVDLVIKCVK